MWNYRAFKNDREEFGIVECYYDKDGKPEMRSEDFMAPFGDDLDSLQADLERMVSALKKPVLTEEDLKRETHSCYGCLECKGNPEETNMVYVCGECVFKQLDTIINSEETES